MENLISFINEFLSYIIIFAIFIIAMLVAGFFGVSLRKKKNNELEGGDAANK